MLQHNHAFIQTHEKGLYSILLMIWKIWSTYIHIHTIIMKAALMISDNVDPTKHARQHTHTHTHTKEETQNNCDQYINSLYDYGFNTCPSRCVPAWFSNTSNGLFGASSRVQCPSLRWAQSQTQAVFQVLLHITRESERGRRERVKRNQKISYVCKRMEIGGKRRVACDQ